MKKIYLQSPLGVIEILGDEKIVRAISYADEMGIDAANPGKALLEAKKQLLDYFKGERKVFDFDYEIEGTDFQEKVWEELVEIKFGEKKSYGEIAEKIGSERAARAVGNANNKNKLSIVIPCHRVVAADGGLCGYAGGEWRKQWLLEFEAS